MAKVVAKQTSMVNVEIDNEEILKAAEDLSHAEMNNLIKKRIMKELRLDTDAFMKDGRWYVEVENWGGSHSWYDDVYLRDVTKDDIEVVKAMKTIFNFMKKGE